jgi:hypothetical protein
MTTYADYVAAVMAEFGTDATPLAQRPRKHCKPCLISSLEDICFSCEARMEDGELPRGFMSPKPETQVRTHYGSP